MVCVCMAVSSKAGCMTVPQKMNKLNVRLANPLTDRYSLYSIQNTMRCSDGVSIKCDISDAHNGWWVAVQGEAHATCKVGTGGARHA